MINLFSLLLSMKNINKQFFFSANMICAARPVCAGTLMFIASIFSISICSNSCAFSVAWYDGQCFGRASLSINSILSFDTLVRPRWSFQIESNYNTILVYFFSYPWTSSLNLFRLSEKHVSDIHHRFLFFHESPYVF